MLFEPHLAYIESKNIIGLVLSFDYLTNEVKIQEDSTGKVHTVNSTIDNIKLLKKVGTLHGQNLFNHDVVKTESGRFYEIVVNDSNIVYLYLLDSKFNRIDDVYNKTTFDGLNGINNNLTMIDNVFVLRNAKNPLLDFNVKIVKEVESGATRYYYACHNKDEEQVDLVKVIYMGHHLLKEEDYVRITLGYDGYLDAVEHGTIKEVHPNELANYVYGKTPINSLEKQPYCEEECCEEPVAPEPCCDVEVCDCCNDCEDCKECCCKEPRRKNDGNDGNDGSDGNVEDWE